MPFSHITNITQMHNTQHTRKLTYTCALSHTHRRVVSTFFVLMMMMMIFGRETATPADDSIAPLLGPVPLVAIPIIAGVGSEVTPMATILDDRDPLEPEKVCTVLYCTVSRRLRG